MEILETIRNKVSKKTFAELGEKPVTISIGVHSYSEVNDKEELFRCADSALYKAKSLGKNRIIQSENQCYLKV